jgi:hypothetical protein
MWDLLKLFQMGRSHMAVLTQPYDDDPHAIPQQGAISLRPQGSHGGEGEAGGSGTYMPPPQITSGPQEAGQEDRQDTATQAPGISQEEGQGGSKTDGQAEEQQLDPAQPAVAAAPAGSSPRASPLSPQQQQRLLPAEASASSGGAGPVGTSGSRGNGLLVGAPDHGSASGGGPHPSGSLDEEYSVYYDDDDMESIASLGGGGAGPGPGSHAAAEGRAHGSHTSHHHHRPIHR